MEFIDAFLNYKPEFVINNPKDKVIRYIRIATNIYRPNRKIGTDPYGQIGLFLNDLNHIYRIKFNNYKYQEKIKKALGIDADIDFDDDEEYVNVNIKNVNKFIKLVSDKNMLIIGEIVKGPNYLRFEFN